MIAALLTLALAAAPKPGTDVVLVLDTSCSMAAPFPDEKGHVFPANDPQRNAVLGALIVQGLAKGSDDAVTVIGFGQTADEDPPTASDAEGVRAFLYTGGTFFRKPLAEARQRLESSTREHRLLMFFTDGAPDDLRTPQEGPAILGLSPSTPFDTLIVGLYGSDDSRHIGESFLTPLGRRPEDLNFVSDARQVVTAFTKGYARVVGARPDTGTLAPGQTKSITVGKYVIEVLVATASSAPGPAFSASLSSPHGAVPVQSQGDNGCPDDVTIRSAPRLCTPPRRHFETFRAPNDPTAASAWSLKLDRAPGPVEYGVILRYDLVATVQVPPSVRVGDPATIEARLLFRGNTVDDPTLFGADGFGAVARMGGHEVPLTHAGGGRFVGTWTPDAPGDVPVEAVFRNTWMEQRATAPLHVEGYLDLKLVVNPNPLDLGTWRGERGGAKRCGTLDLAGSLNADRVPLECTPMGAPGKGALTCTRAADGTLRYEVCFTAPGCCDELAAEAATSVKLQPTPAHYADQAVTVPVRFHVEATGFLRCWWWLIALVTAVLFAIWFLLGWVRPYNFDAAACVRLSGSELGLKRASALVLREQPGGTRGFYRNARIAVNAAGDFVRNPRMAVIVVEAQPSYLSRFVRAGGVERKNRHGHWEPVPEGEHGQGPAPNVLYRVGSLYLKFS